MDKQEFLSSLQTGLAGLPQEDIEERLTFYGEMIDDRMEEGLTEAEAVAELGTVEQVVSQILEETPITRLVRERVRPKRRLAAWEIVLLVLGSPIWLALGIAGFAVVLCVYIVIWAVIVALWAVEVSLVASALGTAAGGVVCFCRGGLTEGLILLSAAAVLAGLAILLFFGCKAVTVGAAKLTKKIALWIKSLFLRKENTK